MKRIRAWLYDKFLPAWCRDDLLERNAALATRLAAVLQENSRLQAYIDGLEVALRYQRRITINNEVKP